MAGRPKKEDEIMDDNKIAENINTNTIIIDELKKENDILKKENEDVKSQIKLILEKLAEQEYKNSKSEDSNIRTQEESKNNFYTDINPLKLIKVISLSDGGVSLKTKPGGDGKIFRFDKFGHSVTITYTDLQDIISTNRSFIEDGIVYICDEDVIKNNYLENAYSKFLTIETINNIFSFPKDKIIDMIKNTTEEIQDSVISFIIKKINNNEYVDMNKVDAIGKSCKIPCNILELAEQKRVK